MQKTTRTKANERNIIRNDLEKLKAVLALTARDVRGQATDAIAQSFETVKDKTTHLRDNVADYVGAKPYKSLALALISGLAVGYIMHHSKKRSNSHR